MLLHRDFSLLRRLEWGAGPAIFLAIAAPWFVLVQQANPEFARFFFVHEHFERFLTTVHRRPGPWWYYFPVLAVLMLPWLSLVPQALLRGWRSQDPPPTFRPARFLAIWTVFVFIFFSASGSKLPSYVLPIVPSLALLAGTWLAEADGRRLWWHAVTMLVAGAAIAAAAPGIIALSDPSGPQYLYQAYTPWIVAGGLLAAAGGLVAAYYCRRHASRPAVIAMACGGLLATQVVTSGHEVLSPWYSGYLLARDMKPHLADGVPLYSVLTYDQTLPFYTGRTATLVGFRDEMDYGLAQEPQLWLPDLPSFETAWRAHRRALAVMEPGTFAELARRGLPMEIVGRDLRRIVVRKPGTAP
jgi:4-amino-4-deoxy-L-arabinose transferase-like glycosyltransferase